ncbi:MAG: M48 family metallopeptidase [Peptostreptococcaceae bacterium]|nr:M48 family metallopeptidase [Peptostreptococcaceae bacterium]
MKKQTNSQCYYLGKAYPLYTKVDASAKKTTVEWDGEAFICILPKDDEKTDIAGAIKLFYKRASRKLIEERLRFYQPGFKVKYRSFAIEDSLVKWGSCNSKRNLTFHWRLMAYPMDVIDYVVVHELCHLVHMNHDRSFWRLVGKVYPGYKEAMEILGTVKTRDI